jgi:hypothetical protein
MRAGLSFSSTKPVKITRLRAETHVQAKISTYSTNPF